MALADVSPEIAEMTERERGKSFLACSRGSKRCSGRDGWRRTSKTKERLATRDYKQLPEN
jgi:hypothetical protein